MNVISKSKPKVLGVFSLTCINLALFGLIHNWSLVAEYGVTSFVFFLIALLVFFIPASIVTAELSSSFRHEGGVYCWVKEAFGAKAAFTAAWLLWFQGVLWTPIPLMWVGFALSFAFHPEWVTNSFFHLMVSLIFLWGITFLVLQGIKWIRKLTIFGVILGSFLPGIVITILGLLWFKQGKTVDVDFSFGHLRQELSKFSNWGLFPAIFVLLFGIEIAPFYSSEVKNPKKTFPRAIALTSLIYIVFSALVSFAIAMFIPKIETLFFPTTLKALSDLFTFFHLSRTFPFFATLLSLDILVSAFNWIAATPLGIHRIAKQGDLPSIFRQVNTRRMPSTILIFQGVFISFIVSLYILFPNVMTVYWVLVSLTIVFHLIVYLFLFASVVKLRYKKPEIERPYKIPGGFFGLWGIAGLGFSSCLVTIVFGFILPQRILGFDPMNYFFLIGAAIILTCLIPAFIHLFKKPEWSIPDDEESEDQELT